MCQVLALPQLMQLSVCTFHDFRELIHAARDLYIHKQHTYPCLFKVVTQPEGNNGQYKCLRLHLSSVYGIIDMRYVEEEHFACE